MAVNSEATCDGFSGSAAPFVTQVTVRVDGVTVATIDHAATDDGPWWSFGGDLDLSGAHVVEVWDRTAGNDYRQEGDNFHAIYELSCPVATTTSQAPEPTVTIGLEVQESTTVVFNTAPLPTLTYSGHEFYVAPTTTLPEPVGCCSDYVGDTTAEVPVATLPATGSASGPMLGVGAVLLALGVVALLTTRRA